MTTGKSRLDAFRQAHRLPHDFRDTATEHFFPLRDWIFRQRKSLNGPLLLGINGCQGSGKSTLADFLETFLTEEDGWRVASLSIDDFYRTREQRTQLAQQVHPLLATRGVPGTHDLDLAQSTLDKLINLSEGESTALPRFDKALDERTSQALWSQLEGPVDLIILEGWCVATPVQPDDALAQPVNRLEAQEDVDGRWRAYVNTALQSYQTLFQRLHKLVMLKAPDFDCVYRWRLEQEHKLAARNDGRQPMSDAEVANFIEHYQRLTEHSLGTLPPRADVVFALDRNRHIVSTHYKRIL